MVPTVNVQLGDPRSELSLQGHALRGRSIYALQKDEKVSELLRQGVLRQVEQQPGRGGMPRVHAGPPGGGPAEEPGSGPANTDAAPRSKKARGGTDKDSK